MITSTDHAGRACILTHNGSPVNRGEILEDFRGDQARILGGRAPHKPGSTGQIHTTAGNFYPSVFGCKWETQQRQKKYIIQSTDNHALKWSNAEGWTSSQDFDTFSESERKTLSLPINGKWVAQ